MRLLPVGGDENFCFFSRGDDDDDDWLRSNESQRKMMLECTVIAMKMRVSTSPIT